MGPRVPTTRREMSGEANGAVTSYHISSIINRDLPDSTCNGLEPYRTFSSRQHPAYHPTDKLRKVARSLWVIVDRHHPACVGGINTLRSIKNAFTRRGGHSARLRADASGEGPAVRGAWVTHPQPVRFRTTGELERRVLNLVVPTRN